MARVTFTPGLEEARDRNNEISIDREGEIQNQATRWSRLIE